ncbi:MAG: 3-hydroxyacyl-CoA dehydrogenase NAD-binding domain-containing protein [Myxococcota bacterium]
MAKLKHRNDAVEAAFETDSGLATLTLAMEGRANKIDDTFADGVLDGLDWALEQEGVKGIVLASAHREWCVGADIDWVYRLSDPAGAFQMVRKLNEVFRKLETCGVPVVAALTGSALGGGYELAMSCHHRVALDSPKVQVGLPEVTLGVIPGAGGTQRLPRLIGLQPGIEQALQGRPVRAQKARKLGMVDALAPTPEAVTEAAIAWIDAHPDAKQPWDSKGFRYPGGVQPGTPDATNVFMGASAMVYKKTAGAMQAPEVILRAIHEGAGLSFDRALEVEGRHFAKIATSDQAKDVMRTFWFHRNAAKRAEGLPRPADPDVSKVAVLGAGMMGSGLAFIAASKGLDVVVRDIAQEALDAGRAHCEGEANKRKHLSQEDRDALLGRITWTLDAADVEGCDLVIEAVAENDEVKAKVTREVEPLLADGAIFASNTSAIPITHLAKASEHPDRFIGLHFFSPVEKMPLLEIVVGEETSEETLARALGIAMVLGKLPIVVNDGYAFYTSRVFGAYLMEGAQLVAEGHDPVLVEWAARQAGMVVPPLQVFDEVTLTLGVHALTQKEKYTGEAVDTAGIRLLRKMTGELDRNGKAAGKGFYDYEGKERRIWSGLRDLATGTPEETGVDYLADRLMYAQIAEVGRALDEGILRHHRDAEVGAVFGIGFAPGSGGPLAWMDRRGLDTVAEDLQRLADSCGERFAPAPTLVEMARNNRRFFEKV